METAFPFILQNLHRYFLYLAFIPLFFLWVDAGRCRSSVDGRLRLGLGVVILFVNAALLTGYSLSCHSLRHLVGGRLDCFSCSRRTQVRYSLWQRLTTMNLHHMAWAWASLITVTLADVYVRLLALGILDRPGDPPVSDAPELLPPRRPRHRRGRGRSAGGDRGRRGRGVGRARLQVAPRQGPHGHGRGRRRGGDGPRRRARQLAGPLPRHDGRRQAPEQPADGRAARQGGAGPGPRARVLGRRLRPDPRRPDPPAAVRRPHLLRGSPTSATGPGSR